MNHTPTRRVFMKSSATIMASGLTATHDTQALSQDSFVREDQSKPRFKISLAQWSMHNAILAGEIDNLDFPRIAKETHGIDAVEWSNRFAAVENGKLGFQPKGDAYLAEVKKRTEDFGVKNLLIMCDKVGNLGDPDKLRRSHAITGHHAWVEAAKFLGCHSIRVNAGSDRRLSADQQRDLCIDGLSQLCEFAQPLGINIIVENHGGLSSNGVWLASVIRGVIYGGVIDGAPQANCGTLPDFGNFYVAKNQGNADRYAIDQSFYQNDPVYRESKHGLEYDRYQGMTDIMPFAKGVSAKAHDFDASGEEINTDFLRMMEIVATSGYSGYIGIEYEGKKASEQAGIDLTKKLLEKSFTGIANDHPMETTFHRHERN